MKFKQENSIKINCSKEEFQRKFRQNVELEKINFFTPPLIERKDRDQYKGVIINDKFKLKKITSFNPHLHLETCYGKVIEQNDSVILNIKILGLQGFSILFLSALIGLPLILLFNLALTKDAEQNGALFLLIPIFLGIFYLIYKRIILQVQKDISIINQNLETEIRNWMKV